MEGLRRSYQGISNIVRFNWHFYVMATLLVVVMGIVCYVSTGNLMVISAVVIAGIIGTTIISLLVSFYVYDLSGLYNLTWLDGAGIKGGGRMLNIHAGFDETSSLLNKKYPDTQLTVFDFYDPDKHTEVSIKRARKAYPAYPDTKAIESTSLPLKDGSVDSVFIILSAHEIRDDDERHMFFKELSRIMNTSGKIVVTEHMRDLPNFLAYNIGFFHFLSETSWRNTFKKAELNICHEMKITPFITTFILEKNGSAS